MAEYDNEPIDDTQSLGATDSDAIGDAEDATLEQGEEESDEEILKTALRRYKISEEAESEIRSQALDDLKFRTGEQWPQDIKIKREQDGRPCLTVNRLPQYGRQVVNDIRQNPSEIKVNPVDDKATPETAKVLQGLIRHIEYVSNAEAAYDTAVECAVNGGFGFFRVITDYSSPDSFQQEIYIKRILDPMSVRLDPHAQEPDASDANYGFIETNMSEEDYRAEFPDTKMSQIKSWSEKPLPGWMSKDSCRIAEYFYKKYVKDEVCLLSNGRTCLKSKLPNPMAVGVTVVKTRPTIVPKVMWCKINGVEILEKRDWAGSYIPIIPIYGNELIVNGKRVLESLMRYAKDPQRMANYWSSSMTESIALAPKAPYIVAAGQLKGFENQWAQANVRNYSFLEYNTKSINGQPAPPPQRQQYEPPIQAITMALSQSKEDIKESTGIQDATLGMRTNEISGAAIQRRNAQSQVSNFHFADNLSRGIKHLGRILIDLIPNIYDTEMAARILKDDGTPEMVLLNQMFGKDGKQMGHFLGIGKYDATVSTGPGYQTKRQEAVASIIDLVRAQPNLVNIVGDLLVKNMDWDGAQQISQRLKAMLPPQIQSLEGGQKQVDPQSQALIAKQNQMIQVLTQHLNDATAIINMKRQEVESKERIEFAKMQTDLTKKVMDIDSKEAIHAFTQEAQHIDRRLDLLNESQPISTINPYAGAQDAMAQGQANQQQQPAIGGKPPS